MKIIINKNKPFYHNKKNKTIRLGNFKNTAKELTYEEDEMLLIFSYLKKPIEYEELIDLVYNSTKKRFSKKLIIDAINYLMQEGFIINYDNYRNVIKDENNSRMNLYFSMFNNSYINFDKLMKNKKILILGLGGIGSNVFNILLRSGFERFIIVDNDIVEISNLQKQYIYNKCDVGKSKISILEKKAIKYNKNVKIISFNRFIKNERDLYPFIKKADLVISTMDKPSRKIRRIVNSVCVKENKPVIFAGFSEHYGMIGPFVIPNKTACLVCNDKKTEFELIENRKIIPSYGPLCLAISSIISDEVINFFTKFKKKEFNLQGKTLMLDFYNYTTSMVIWNKKTNCKECGKNASK